MKIVECSQGSVEWLEKRAGIPTASEFDNLVSPTGQIRRGQMPASYLAKKVAEKWHGPLPAFSSHAMEQGHIIEPEVVSGIEFEFGWNINRVGFITTDDGKIGASPDGLIGDDGGIEIKAPLAETHVKYLLAGGVPEEYRLQCQGSLFVTGRKWWRFVSYKRGFPSHVVEIEPDHQIQEALAEALELFLSKLESSYKYLLELNGGPPPKREPMVFSNQFVPDMEDVLQ